MSSVYAEENEFILYATRKSIHRYNLASGATEQLPLSGLRAAVALDFDYEHNCLYWSDLALDLIQVCCLDLGLWDLSWACISHPRALSQSGWGQAWKLEEWMSFSALSWCPPPPSPAPHCLDRPA